MKLMSQNQDILRDRGVYRGWISLSSTQQFLWFDIQALSSSTPPLRPSRPVLKFDLRWSLIWYIKTPRLFPNPSLTRIVSIYHTCHNNGMICLLITTKTLFYWANADENGFLHVFSTGNLLNSRSCAKERKRTVHMSTKVAGQVFFILHRKRRRFHALLNNFKVCKYA